MAFSEVELVFLAFTSIFPLGFLLGRNNNTSTVKNTKKERKSGKRIRVDKS